MGAISLLSVGALLAQQPTQSGAKGTQPAAQATQPQAQPAAKTQAAPKAQAGGKMKAAAPKWTKDQIKDAQEGLMRAKMFKGPANGMMGAATRRAIKAFQKEHKMTANGMMSDSLLGMLKAIP